MPSITIVGCGPGSRDYATGAALRAIAESEVIVGAQRLIDDFGGGKKALAFTSVEDTLRVLRDHTAKKVAVLVTGDPAFFSLTSCIINEMGKQQVSIVPGISSITYAFGKQGIPWHDAAFLSAHNVFPAKWNSIVTHFPKIGVLTSPKHSVSALAGMINSATARLRRFYVGQRLSYPDESLGEYAHAELCKLKTDTLSVLVITTLEEY
jgi:cobalt-precorrin-7 (C5)-methyltransferase